MQFQVEKNLFALTYEIGDDLRSCAYKKLEPNLVASGVLTQEMNEVQRLVASGEIKSNEDRKGHMREIWGGFASRPSIGWDMHRAIHDASLNLRWFQ